MHGLPRYVGLDVGDRRIGVAISDPLGLIATPLFTLVRKTPNQDVNSIAELCNEYTLGGFIVGLPITLDGVLGIQAQKVQTFAKLLGDASLVPIKFLDERYTTAEAERIIREVGGKPSMDKARVDAVAATVILQEYLDNLGEM